MSSRSACVWSRMSVAGDGGTTTGLRAVPMEAAAECEDAPRTAGDETTEEGGGGCGSTVSTGPALAPTPAHVPAPVPALTPPPLGVAATGGGGFPGRADAAARGDEGRKAKEGPAGMAACRSLAASAPSESIVRAAASFSPARAAVDAREQCAHRADSGGEASRVAGPVPVRATRSEGEKEKTGCVGADMSP